MKINDKLAYQQLIVDEPAFVTFSSKDIGGASNSIANALAHTRTN